VNQKLPLNLSLYLDLIRITAAFIVFTMHLQEHYFPLYSWGPFSCGREAVAAFFVISGFVICHVTQAKEADWRSYAVARIARIYPVAIIAILLTLLCDGLAHLFNPLRAAELMQQFVFGNAPSKSVTVLSMLTFTNQIWYRVWMLSSDGPYWSLGFEIPYYLLFGLYLWVPQKWRWPVLVLWGLFYGPNICLYLPLWLLGVWTYHYIERHPSKSWLDVLEFQIISWSILGTALFLSFYVKIAMFIFAPIKGSLVGFVYFTLVGLAVSLQLISFHWLSGQRQIFPQPMQKLIRTAASCSFSLYLFHQPLLYLAGVLFPAQIGTPLGAVAITIAILLIVYLLAQIGERQKHFYVRLLRPLFGLREKVSV